MYVAVMSMWCIMIYAMYHIRLTKQRTFNGTFYMQLLFYNIHIMKLVIFFKNRQGSSFMNGKCYSLQVRSLGKVNSKHSYNKFTKNMNVVIYQI